MVYTLYLAYKQWYDHLLLSTGKTRRNSVISQVKEKEIAQLFNDF